MKFKAQTKAGILLDWLHAIRAVTDECIILRSKQYVVEVRVVDPTNALALSMRIPDHVRNGLELSFDDPVGIDVDLLITAVAMFDRDEGVTISSKYRESWNMVFVAGSSAVVGVARIDPAHIQVPPSNLVTGELPAKFSITAVTLQRVVKMAKFASDNLVIGVSLSGSVGVFSESGHGYYQETIPESDIAEVTILDDSVQSTFSISYLKPIVNAMRGTVKILLGQDEPIQLSCVLHKANVVFIQAPVIDRGKMAWQNKITMHPRGSQSASTP